MSKFYSITEVMKRHNALTGMAINDLVTFVFFLVNPISLIYWGDLDFIIGSICGLTYAVYHRKQSQGVISLSLVVAISGGILSAISISIHTYFAYYALSSLNVFFGIHFSFILMGGIVGTLIGSIGGLIVYLVNPRTTEVSDDTFKPFKMRY
ncbi:MAG: hypothetical protein ACFFFG_06900 [Candidatus Thorarchaeota archaeon]